MALNLTTAAIGTAVGLSEDLQSGLIDRFRTLPMWPGPAGHHALPAAHHRLTTASAKLEFADTLAPFVGRKHDIKQLRQACDDVGLTARERHEASEALHTEKASSGDRQHLEYHQLVA